MECSFFGGISSADFADMLRHQCSIFPNKAPKGFNRIFQLKSSPKLPRIGWWNTVMPSYQGLRISLIWILSKMFGGLSKTILWNPQKKCKTDFCTGRKPNPKCSNFGPIKGCINWVREQVIASFDLIQCSFLLPFRYLPVQLFQIFDPHYTVIVSCSLEGNTNCIIIFRRICNMQEKLFIQ